MKTALSLLSLLLLSASLQAQLLNGGFEDWKTLDGFENPVGFYTTNFDSYIFQESSGVSEISSPTGNGIHIQGYNILGFASPGICSHNNKLLQGTQSLPYTDEPTGFTVSARYQAAGSDSVSVSLKFLDSQDNIINEATLKLGGSQNTFTDYRRAIPAFTEKPVALIFEAISSSSGLPSLDSWIEIDRLTIDGGSQIPNNTFDDWENRNYDQPDGWNSLDFISEPILDINAVFIETSLSSEGSTSVGLASSDADFTDDVGIEVTYLTNGTPSGDMDEVHGGTELTGNATVSFDYIYRKNNQTTGVALLFLNAHSKTEPLATLELEVTNSWQSISHTVDASAGDSLVIAFIPGYDADIDGPAGLAGDTLWIDNVKIDMISSTPDLVEEGSMDIYYAPTAEEIRVELEESSALINLTIFSSEGKVVRQVSEQQLSELVIPTHDLNSGFYTVSCVTDAGRGIQRIFIP